ncbi:DUF2235 domain-containing protein [Spirosoma sp. RP8]|uniref:DUF2235 domain-containing protein n=1 Tax=Spirosoma liriopis TaxID=2937440 RepID=A0ABT0HSK3_9BACT|nr:DUF2235 domain-containing protein [Spirosoma liriopis]MCK8495144.1 DUF2235 domain-containing protein [Spirosoma liriopis]
MSKKIIVCSDGTWNDPEQLDRGSLVPTNVVKIARALALAKAPDQKDIFYDMGVGTGKGFDRWLGGLTGAGLLHNIFQCYQFIAERYQPGDKIYLFGFSRGAYTVRSVAGLIGKFGLDKSLTMPELLSRHTDKPPITTEQNRPAAQSARKADESSQHLNELRDAYLKLKENPDSNSVEHYRSTHDCYDVTIEMLGVWDTVGSLGIPLLLPRQLMSEATQKWISDTLLGKYRFLDVSLNSRIKAAYHALSIDENRRPFSPTLWSHSDTQVVRQVWFPGIHSNVGGGYADTGLSDNALLWMVAQASKDAPNGGHDLAFSQSYLDRSIRPDAFYGEIRDERVRLLKRILMQKGLRNINELCGQVGIQPVIARSALERMTSTICKKRYEPILPDKYAIEEGF